MTRILNTDWVPRYEDAGYDELIESLSVEGLEHDEFLARLNAAGSQPPMTLDMLLKYIIDRKASGGLSTIDVRGAPYPQHTPRPDAPTGLGGSVDGVWFSGPAKNVGETDTGINWYVNGSLKSAARQNVTSDRSAPASVTADLSKGDIVQVCVVSGAVGWWARLEV